jgi:phosphopantothenate synthetase
MPSRDTTLNERESSGRASALKVVGKEVAAMKKNENRPAGRTFTVTITETLRREITVNESELKEPTVTDAEQTVRDWWNNGQIILNADDFTDVEFSTEETTTK